MSDVDSFELRFATAYRRYLDEAETDVDAAAVARSVVAAGARRRGIAGLPLLRPAPASAWLVVVVALVAVAMAGAWLLGMRLPSPPVTPVASPTSPAPSAPGGLLGTWSSGQGHPSVLVLHPCGLGELCGRLERFDSNAEHCVYQLEYRPPEGDTAVFWSEDANSFGCAWSAWFQTEIHVRPADGDSVVVWSGSPGGDAVTLARTSGQAEPQLAPTIAGEWFSAGDLERLHLDPCGPGEWCGSFTRFGSTFNGCSYSLQHRPKTYEEHAFWIASANGSPCDASGWLHTTLLVRPMAVGTVLVTHEPGVAFTLHSRDVEPAPTAGPSPSG